MYALDFVYDGQYLSDYGFIICDFSPSSGFDIASAGSEITFKTVSHNRGKRYGLVGAQYDKCIQVNFGICTDPDIFDDLTITDDEYRDLMRWLNRSEFLKFHVLYEYDDFTAPCFYEGSFNISKVKVREILYGLELTFESNRPFGYGMEQVFKFKLDDSKPTFKLRDLSDEIGYIYPTVNILCYEDGDLTITNDLTGCKMTIKNCIATEEITLDGNTHIITSSNEKHDICNDFNYDYFKIGNTFTNRNNFISSSLPCVLEIKYHPIIKGTP